MREILDTRFLLECFFSRDPVMVERAREKLRNLRRAGSGIIPTIALAEFCYSVCQRAGRKSAEQGVESLVSSGLFLFPLTPRTATLAGTLRCELRDVPLADCIIAATAIQARGKVISDDPHFKRFKKVKAEWI